MTRRFEVGPILVALGALLLLVSLFLEWYGPLSAWEAFEVVEVLLAALAVGALVVAAGQLVPDLELGDRRWLPPIVAAVAVLVVAELIDPPPAAGAEDLAQGAWLAFAAALVMVAGAVLTVGRISFAIAVEGRELRERVAVLDHRQETADEPPRRGRGTRQQLEAPAGGRRRAHREASGSLMPAVDVAFELERFGWSEPGRLEVVGRWSGLEGRRMGRPVLTVVAGGRRRRLTALPGGQLTGSEWRATFACDDDPASISEAVLEIGRRLVVDLPPPREPRRAATDPSLERLHEERLRREQAEGTLAERDAELVSLREEADAALAEREAESERLTGELAEAREALAAAEQERERLAAELTRVTADLAIRDEELTLAREEVRRASVEAEERLTAERAATTEVREKLATAREEAESTITAESHETERLRAELESAREETERSVAAERAETARLREALAAQSGAENGSEAETAAKRMYERIARELEQERAAARHLRRELDAVQAQTAEHRRESSSAAANGVTEDVPALTPAGRRRSEVGRAAAHQRAGAARAAAAQRVPHSRRSQVAVWAIRIAALVFVVAFLVTGVLIVSWVA